jgi:RHS repeat-associated protein
MVANNTKKRQCIVEQLRYMLMLPLLMALSWTFAQTPLGSPSQTNTVVSGQTVGAGQTAHFSATDTLFIGGVNGNVVFQNGSTVYLSAGKSVIMLPGFHAQAGSRLNATILEHRQVVVPSQINQAISTGQTLTTVNNMNYVRIYSYRKATNPSDGNVNDVNIDVHYYDGLGRPYEVVEVRASPTGKDIVRLQTYDAFGRSHMNYLPITGVASGGLPITEGQVTAAMPGFLSNNFALGAGDAQHGFSMPVYENSPMGRVVQQGHPGTQWQPGQHPDSYAYGTNTELVGAFKYTGTSFAPFSYNPGSLYVQTGTDADDKQTRTYTDMQGKVVLRETFDGTQWLKTRYCYDDMGKLRCMVQPSATGPSITQSCFFYNYDHRGRMVAKRIPGSDWAYMVYDKHDRLVVVSDGNSRKLAPTQYTYRYFRYDGLNRLIEEGDMHTTASTAILTDHFESDTTLYASATSYRFTTKYYYGPNSAPRIKCRFTPITGWVVASDTATCSVAQLSGTVYRTYCDSNYIKTNERAEAYYYDKLGRMVQTVSENFAGGKETETHVYNFSGQVTRTRHSHYVQSSAYTLDKHYTYDHRGRQLSTEYEVDGYYHHDVPRTIVSANVYNEAGLLQTKYLHSQGGQAFMQKIDYKYNIRGWLSEINSPELADDKFWMKLAYNEPLSTPGSGYWNGNISGVQWKTAGQAHSSGFSYTYDGCNRLSTSGHNTNGVPNGKYASSYSYNKNGNFTALTRYGISETIPIDQITMGYFTGSNQLKYAADPYIDSGFRGNTSTAQQFTYDPNGNVTRDNYRAVTIHYNRLNLPQEMDFGGNNKMYYFYDPAGGLMQRAVCAAGHDPVLTSFFGPFVREGTQGGTNNLKYILTSEGRIMNYGTDHNPVWKWEYNLVDHLGNVRLVLEPGALAGTATVLQENHYYPFGMRINELSTSSGTNNPYLYNNKELQTGFGLNWYNYIARFYDPEVPRFTGVDPLAEKYPWQSTYVYAAGNPIRYIDWMGLGPLGADELTDEEWMETSRPNSDSRMSREYRQQNLAAERAIADLSNFVHGKFKQNPHATVGGLLPGDWNGEGEGTKSGYSLITEPIEQDFRGLWGGLKYVWTGGNIDGYHYNLEGQATGLAPMMGVAPSPGIGKVGTYAKLAKMTKGYKGAIQAHHIVEVRHLRRLMKSANNAPSVILNRTDHAAMTKTLQQLLPYGQTYTKPQLINAYKQAYSKYPEWVDLAVKYLY